MRGRRKKRTTNVTGSVKSDRVDGEREDDAQVAETDDEGCGRNRDEEAAGTRGLARVGEERETTTDSLAEVEDGEDEDGEEHVGEELVHEDPLKRLSRLGEEGEDTGRL